MSKHRHEYDMTRGNVRRQLTLFALPLLLSNLLQAAYTLADMAVVGRWAGGTGLAAVGQALVTVVGQNMGAGAPERAALAVRTAVRLNVVVTGLTVLGINLAAHPLISLFSADPAIVAEAVRYLRVCCSAGTVIYSAMYAYDSFLTGIGASGLATGNALLDGTLIRLPLAWLLGTARGYGFMGVYAAQALSPLLPALAGWAWLRFGPWRTGSLVGPPLRP